MFNYIRYENIHEIYNENIYFYLQINMGCHHYFYVCLNLKRLNDKESLHISLDFHLISNKVMNNLLCIYINLRL